MQQKNCFYQQTFDLDVEYINKKYHYNLSKYKYKVLKKLNVRRYVIQKVEFF